MILTQHKANEQSLDLNFLPSTYPDPGRRPSYPISDHPFWQLRSNALVWVALPASAQDLESLLSSLVPAVVCFRLLANEGRENGYLVSVRTDLFPFVVAALLYLRCLSSAGLVRLGLR